MAHNKSKLVQRLFNAMLFSLLAAFCSGHVGKVNGQISGTGDPVSFWSFEHSLYINKNLVGGNVPSIYNAGDAVNSFSKVFVQNTSQASVKVELKSELEIWDRTQNQYIPLDEKVHAVNINPGVVQRLEIEKHEYEVPLNPNNAPRLIRYTVTLKAGGSVLSKSQKVLALHH